MKVAVTYEDGKVFQHFGKTKEFKIYNITDGKLTSARIIDCGDTGHEALADLLKENDVDTLICGGLGGGAQAALAAAGIEVFSGAEGSADSAVEAFMANELKSEGVNCDHHGHHEEEAGGCGSGCGGGCGGCGGGCGPQVILDGPNAGKVVRVHYRGTFDDGSQFDSSYDRGEPLEFVCGTGMMIPGFDAAVAEMEVGTEKDIHLMPEDAYGLPNPQLILNFPIDQLPGSENLKLGDRVGLQSTTGQQIPVTVIEKTEETITLDANHEMAGKELNFHIELLSAE